MRIKKYNTLELREEVSFSKLYKNAMSAFTKNFASETSKLMGAPTRHSKLIQMKANEKKDYITFLFATERTPKYKDNFNMGVVNPQTFKILKDNLYTIEIRILDFFTLLNKELVSSDEPITNNTIESVFKKANVQVWSDVPAFHWQGCNYYLSQLDGSIHPTDIEPKHWDQYHRGQQLLDKHSGGIINSIAFYIPQMRMMIKKYFGITKKKK